MIRTVAWASTLITAVLAVSPDPSSTRVVAGLVYVAAGTAALVRPIAVTIQTVLGMGLAASLILSGRADPLFIVPVVAGTILAAELLGHYWTESLPFKPERHSSAAAAVGPVLVAGGVYALVLMAGSLPGPTGMGAVLLAAAATIAAAASLGLPGRSR